MKATPKKQPYAEWSIEKKIENFIFKAEKYAGICITKDDDGMCRVDGISSEKGSNTDVYVIYKWKKQRNVSIKKDGNEYYFVVRPYGTNIEMRFKTWSCVNWGEEALIFRAFYYQDKKICEELAEKKGGDLFSLYDILNEEALNKELVLHQSKLI